MERQQGRSRISQLPKGILYDRDSLDEICHWAGIDELLVSVVPSSRLPQHISGGVAVLEQAKTWSPPYEAYTTSETPHFVEILLYLLEIELLIKQKGEKYTPDRIAWYLNRYLLDGIGQERRIQLSRPFDAISLEWAILTATIIASQSNP